jgi:hypothetical protein
MFCFCFCFCWREWDARRLGCTSYIPYRFRGGIKKVDVDYCPGRKNVCVCKLNMSGARKSGCMLANIFTLFPIVAMGMDVGSSAAPCETAKRPFGGGNPMNVWGDLGKLLEVAVAWEWMKPRNLYLCAVRGENKTIHAMNAR